MRTVIFGAEGQLGRDLWNVFRADHEVVALGRGQADILDERAVREALESVRAELVINAAGYTNVEAAEDDPEGAFRVNAEGARIVARAATEASAGVVYVSTDYVFGGSKSTPYEPGDAVSPIGVYARSKGAGEDATRQACAQHFIVRTAWLYGPGGGNFVEKILGAAATRASLKVVNDEVGSPTHTHDLARAILALVGTSAYGDYHAVNRGSCTRFDFAREILRLAGMATPIVPCSSAEFPTKAERPLYSVLSSAKLESVTGHSMRPWQEALRHYMKRRVTHS